ncbi:hypothetical protein BN1184_AD_00030 [Pantoea ananatis]|jgi:hypothetical protein|nr:hypothetical protein BN1183_AC_00110 [Pantoea ananatis]CRH35561.1 hypothetical protein BN1184_AD_00030 [Pantoea ananatis]
MIPLKASSAALMVLAHPFSFYLSGVSVTPIRKQDKGAQQRSGMRIKRLPCDR